MKAVFDHVAWQTEHIATFWFQSERRLRFEAGQYVELTVPHAGADNRGVTRWMSISSSPHEPLLAITTAFPVVRPSSYKRALRALQPGDTVLFGEPIGDFVLPKNADIPLVFVAGGIGIAPVHSILQWLASQSEQRSVQLIYSVSSPHELAFTEFLTSQPLDFLPMVSRPSHGWHGQTGRLTAIQVLQLLGDATDKLIYLSGPQRLIEPLWHNLIADGIARAQLILDYFPGY